MMLCEFAEWASGYLDGELDLEEQEAFEWHLKMCSECIGELTKLSAIKGMMSSARPTGLADVAWDTYLEKLRRRLKDPSGLLLVAVLGIWFAYVANQMAAAFRATANSGALLAV
jgi:anti-sigma factor RsiW